MAAARTAHNIDAGLDVVEHDPEGLIGRGLFVAVGTVTMRIDLPWQRPTADNLLVPAARRLGAACPSGHSIPSAAARRVRSSVGNYDTL